MKQINQLVRAWQRARTQKSKDKIRRQINKVIMHTDVMGDFPLSKFFEAKKR
jgi:hypothetical protein